MDGIAKTRKVISVDLQAHGHTAYIDLALNMEFMADDIEALLLQYPSIKKAHIISYFLGGGVPIQTVIRHQEMGRILIVVSDSLRSDRMYPEVPAGIVKMNAVDIERVNINCFVSIIFQNSTEG